MEGYQQGLLEGSRAFSLPPSQWWTPLLDMSHRLGLRSSGSHLANRRDILDQATCLSAGGRNDWSNSRLTQGRRVCKSSFLAHVSHSHCWICKPIRVARYRATKKVQQERPVYVSNSLLFWKEAIPLPSYPTLVSLLLLLISSLNRTSGQSLHSSSYSRSHGTSCPLLNISNSHSPVLSERFRALVWCFLSSSAFFQVW